MLAARMLLLWPVAVDIYLYAIVYYQLPIMPMNVMISDIRLELIKLENIS